jgi:hypothetical protein
MRIRVCKRYINKLFRNIKGYNNANMNLWKSLGTSILIINIRYTIANILQITNIDNITY